MKYKELDSENIEDERNYSNYKITFILGTIAATWALKLNQTESNSSLNLTLIFSVSYIAFEIIRMFCSVTHNQTVLDRAYERHKANKTATPLSEEEISGSMFNSNWGKTSHFFYIIDHFILAFTFIAFIIGASQCI
jgi:hypothetical protein